MVNPSPWPATELAAAGAAGVGLFAERLAKVGASGIGSHGQNASNTACSGWPEGVPEPGVEEGAPGTPCSGSEAGSGGSTTCSEGALEPELLELELLEQGRSGASFSSSAWPGEGQEPGAGEVGGALAPLSASSLHGEAV